MTAQDTMKNILGDDFLEFKEREVAKIKSEIKWHEEKLEHSRMQLEIYKAE